METMEIETDSKVGVGVKAKIFAKAIAGWVDWLFLFAPLRKHSDRFEGEEAYWTAREKENGKLWQIERSRWQFITGGSSLVLRERRSELLTLVLYCQFLLVGLVYYAVVFQLVFEALGNSLESIDSSGSLSAVISTFLLIIIFLLMGILAIPCFIMNNVRSGPVSGFFSLSYYCAMLAFLPLYMLWKTESDLVSEDYRLVVTVISGVYSGVGVMIGCYVVVISGVFPDHCAYRNRVNACRRYTKERLRLLADTWAEIQNASLTKSVLLNPLTSEKVTVLKVAPGKLEKRSWMSKRSTSLGVLLKRAWIPTTEVLGDMDPVLLVHDSVLAAMGAGVIVLCFIGLRITGLAEGAHDWIGERANNYAEAIERAEAYPGASSTNATSFMDFLQNSLEFWEDLQRPAYQSIMGGGYLAIAWSASYIPAFWFGFRRTLLELRVGIADQPGLLSASRNSEMAPFRALFLFGSYISCVAFLWVLSFLVFFLVVLLCTWPPMWEIVWSLNWLWLPSCVLLVFNMIVYNCWLLKRYHGKTSSKDKNNVTLIRPREWAFVELGLTLAYLPAYLLSAFMRCVYILLIAFLGVLRVDTSLLPTGTHTFDSPYMAFAALCLRTNNAEAPVFLVAAEMFRCTTSGRSPAWLRTRSRLWLAVMLMKYPFLIPLRQSQDQADEENTDPKSSSSSEAATTTADVSIN